MSIGDFNYYNPGNWGGQVYPSAAPVAWNGGYCGRCGVQYLGHHYCMNPYQQGTVTTTATIPYFTTAPVEPKLHPSKPKSRRP